MKQTITQFPILSLFLFCSLFGFVACKKDEKPLTAKEKQLTAREWKITDIARPKISNPSQDSSIMKTCTSDDRLVFWVSGNTRSFQLKDNTVKCDSTIFFYDNGNWTINAAQDQVQLTGARRVQKWNILILNDSILKVQWRDSVSTSNNVLKTISLKNK